MGLFIIRKKGGSSDEDLREFKHKVMSAKKLMDDICEDVESMEAEHGELSAREHYRDRYDDHERYRDDYDRYGERRRY